MCKLASSETLQCVTGDKVVINGAAHTATLTSSYGDTLAYYEKDYEPHQSPMSGHWQKTAAARWCSSVAFDIPYAPIGATKFENVKGYTSGGFGTFTYYLAVGNYGLYFGTHANMMGCDDFYLYDADNKKITDIKNINSAVKLVGACHSACELVKSS
jgi:hypothetical protein